MAWPFRHNWSSSYRVTYSFFTDVLVSRSGYEQRIAERIEPRRVIETSVLADGDTVRALERYLWTTQSNAFTHVDPVTGQSSLVRVADTQTIDHPAGGVSVAAFALAVEPGTDTYAEPALNAEDSYQGRYLFPFAVNWQEGVPDSLFTPRQTVDYGRGRISVTRPIPFATRTSTLTLLRASRAEATALVEFHRGMHGRQGEFWFTSVLDDFEVLDVSGTTLTVRGADVAAMYMADAVNAGVRLTMRSGAVHYRQVVDAQVSGGLTLLSLAMAVPELVNTATVRECSWMRVGRFASDDLTIEWRTNTVAQAQVQVQTLPYVAPENTLNFDEGTQWLIDYYGGAFVNRYFFDALFRVLNVLEPEFAQPVDAGTQYLIDTYTREIADQTITGSTNQVVNVIEPRFAEQE